MAVVLPLSKDHAYPQRHTRDRIFSTRRFRRYQWETAGGCLFKWYKLLYHFGQMTGLSVAEHGWSLEEALTLL